MRVGDKDHYFLKHWRPFIKVLGNTLHDTKCEIKQNKRGESEKQSPTTKIENPKPGETFLGMDAFPARTFAVNNNNNKGNKPIIPSWKTAAIICNYVNKTLLVEIIWLPWKRSKHITIRVNVPEFSLSEATGVFLFFGASFADFAGRRFWKCAGGGAPAPLAGRFRIRIWWHFRFSCLK